MLVVMIVILVVLAFTVPFIPVLAMDMMGMMLVDRPWDVEGWIAYGKLLQWRGYGIAAAAAFRSAVNQDSLHKEAWRRIGDILAKLGDFEGADEAYRFSI